MEKSRAIELLKLAVPIKALTQQEYADFVEAVNMGMDALKAQLSKEGTTSELISRQAAIDAINSWRGRFSEEYNEAIDDCENSIKELPTVQPEPTDINAKEAVYNLAEKIGIHQPFALTVELRGEPIQPEPHEGHWIDKGWDGDWAWQIDGHGNCWRVIECSECGKGVSVESNYCPHCGARMKGDANGKGN